MFVDDSVVHSFLVASFALLGTGMLVQVSQFHGLDNAWFSQTGVRHTQRFCDICHIFDVTRNRCEVHKGFWHIRIKGLGHKGSAAIWLGNNCLAPVEERKGAREGCWLCIFIESSSSSVLSWLPYKRYWVGLDVWSQIQIFRNNLRCSSSHRNIDISPW